MSKIFRHNEKESIKSFMEQNPLFSLELKTLIMKELHTKETKYKHSSIWLILRNEIATIDAFDEKGEVFETCSYFFKDFPVTL